MNRLPHTKPLPSLSATSVTKQSAGDIQPYRLTESTMAAGGRMSVSSSLRKFSSEVPTDDKPSAIRARSKMAEARRRKAMPPDGAASAEPNLFELCRVVTEEGKATRWSSERRAKLV